MDIDREKYKALYEYQKLQFEDEKGPFFRLEILVLDVCKQN